MEKIKAGDIVALHRINDPKDRWNGMGAQGGSLALVLKAPEVKTWSHRRKVLDVIWLDKKAGNQSNGGYYARDFKLATIEEKDTLDNRKVLDTTPAQVRNLIHILSYTLKAN